MKVFNISQKQVTQHTIINRLIRREITEKEASELLGISVRQIRRLKQKVRLYGIEGLRNGNTGRTPWNKREITFFDQVVTLYQTKYEGSNCLHFQDMLATYENIIIPRESLRRIFLAYSLPRKKHRTPRRFERRERKPQVGMLIQQDTSFHDWFSTGIPCALIASIDDATNEVVFAQFFPSDGTLPNMIAMKTITETKGIAVAYYVDRASHFKTTRHESIHVQLKGTYDETQIGRALKDIGSILILALSPQAKGRVERLFETLQDRLVKELKWNHVTSLFDGNQFLHTWIPAFNKRFCVVPTSTVSAYRKTPNHLRFDLIFSVQEERIVKHDNTISFEGNDYLIQQSKTRVSFAKAIITVHQCTDGIIRIFYKGEKLAYTMGWTKSLGNQ